jgi:hypothetical protein
MMHQLQNKALHFKHFKYGVVAFYVNLKYSNIKK